MGWGVRATFRLEIGEIARDGLQVLAVETGTASRAAPNKTQR
jgi:hypothetical protein